MGRVDELRRLRGLVVDDRYHGVVLAGSAGVGKTRMAREFLRVAEELGFAVAHATATSSASLLPFGALAPLLPRDVRVEGAVDDPAWLLRRWAAALVEAAGSRRLVVSVDDAHLLDDASATLVHHLAATASAFLLVTMRTGEPVRDAIVALWRDGLVERIELPALTDDAVVDLLVGALGGPVDAVAAATLAGRAQGNVLFLRELVEGALQAGVLVDEGGGLWRLRGELSPSDRLVELVDARLGHLEPAEHTLLEAVAYGEPLGQAELAAVGKRLEADDRRRTGRGDRDALVLAESLERRGLLHSQVSGRRLGVSLAHPLYGEVLRSRVPAIRARAIARMLAEAIEATGARRREDTLRVASWRLTGGGGRPEVLLAGATEARWLYDFPLAERLAHAAIDAGAGFDAALLAAQLALLQGRAEEADRALVHLAGTARDDVERSAVALTRTEIAIWTGQDGRHIADEALPAVQDPGLRAALQAAHAHLTLVCSGPEAGADATAGLLRRAGGRALSHACMVASYSFGRLGRIEESLDAAARGQAAQMATAEPLPWYPWYQDAMRCLAYHYAGRFADADALAEAQYREAVQARSVEAQAMFSLVPAWCATGERGRAHTAARRTGEVVALSRALGRPVMERLGLLYGALALALAGRVKEAEASLAVLAALPIVCTRHDAVDLIQARAWTAVAAGDLPRAREHLAEAAQLGEEIGDLVGAASAFHGLARLGRAQEVYRPLAAVAVRIEGELAAARVAHTDALARHDGDALAAVSHRFEAMGADLLAAEAAADAAVARRRSGRVRAAAAEERRARALARRCENPVTPALRGIQARALLTASERETALLAATGLSNRDIASRQHLSVRTVENRLQRTYEKLGISRRSDLAGALDTESPAGSGE